MSFLKLSVSRTKTFTQCAKKYHFNYILRLPTKERDYLIFGKCAHKILEDFHKAYLEGSLRLPHEEMAIAYKAGIAEFGHKLSDILKQDIREIMRQYLVFLDQRPEGASQYIKSILAVEKSFTIPISEKIGLTGMIDVVQNGDDGILHIADYKTTKNLKYLKNDWFQLLTYAWVMLQEDPNIQKVKGSYILLRHNFAFISTIFTRDQIFEIAHSYEEYGKQIEEEKDWAANPNVLCSYCDFLEHCRPGKNFLAGIDDSDNQENTNTTNTNLSAPIKFGQSNW